MNISQKRSHIKLDVTSCSNIRRNGTFDNNAFGCLKQYFDIQFWTRHFKVKKTTTKKQNKTATTR